jgi:hypothetical protein
MGFSQRTCLPALGGADGVLGVHAIGQGDVDGVDGGVGGDAVEVLVAVDGAGGDAVLCGDALGLVAMAADEGGDFGLLGGARAIEKMLGDAAEADDGIADAAGVRFWGRGGGGLGERAGQGVGGKTDGTDAGQLFGEIAACERHGSPDCAGAAL